MGRARPATSGEMCLFWDHYAITLCSLCGSHTVPPIADGEKEKWTLLPIGSLAYVPAPTGLLSFSSLSPPLSRGHTGNSPMKKRNICHLYADNPIRAGYPPNATPRSYAKPFSPHPPSQTQTCRLLLWNISTDSVPSPCRACERVSHCTCDVLSTRDRCQVHFLSPSTLSPLS